MMFSKMVVALLTVALLAMASPTLRADEPETVKVTKRLIEQESKMILRASHPLGKFTDAVFNEHSEKSGVYEFVYTINWKGKEKKEEVDFATKFAFLCSYDADGNIEKMEIEVRSDSCPSKAFRGANVVAGVLRKQIKKRLDDLGIEDEQLLKSLDKMDADGLLAVWLKYAGRKKQK